MRSRHPSTDDARKRHAAELARRLDLAIGPFFGETMLAGIEATDRGLRLELEQGSQRVSVILEPRDPSRRCFASTASFNIVHEKLPNGQERELVPMLKGLASSLRERDPGGLSPIHVVEPSAFPYESRAPEMLRTLPGADLPEARALCARLDRLMALGLLVGDQIEPSITLGSDNFRFIVNVSSPRIDPSLRVSAVHAALDAFGLSASVDAHIVEQWLASENNTLMLGVTIGPNDLRQKAYFRPLIPDAASLKETFHALNIPIEHSLPDNICLFGLDFSNGSYVGHKHYTIPESGFARAYAHGLLLPFLERVCPRSSSLSFIESWRHDAEGRAVEVSLHAEFRDLASPEIAEAYAIAAGYPNSARAIRHLAEHARIGVNVLSEPREGDSPRHVYLALECARQV